MPHEWHKKVNLGDVSEEVEHKTEMSGIIIRMLFGIKRRRL